MAEDQSNLQQISIVTRDEGGRVTAASACSTCNDQQNPDNSVHQACGDRLEEQLYRHALTETKAKWAFAVLQSGGIISADGKLINASPDAGNAAQQLQATQPVLYARGLAFYRQSLAAAKQDMATRIKPPDRTADSSPAAKGNSLVP